MRVSAVIITYNEAANIREAIDSVAWADEILVVDSESTDHTREIAQAMGARVILRAWSGFADQKQFAADEAANDRILSIDADERVTPELRDELLAVCEMDAPADGYRISRLAVYCGAKIKHGGWYPDRQLRFFDRRRGSWKKVPVHESVEMLPGSSIENLTGDLLHFTVYSLAEHKRMIETRYAPLSAQMLKERGVKGSLVKTSVLPLAAFIKTLLLRGGILDGRAGVAIAFFAGYNVFLKHYLLWRDGR